MYSMKEKVCGDTNAVVGKISRRRKKSKHMLRPSRQFLEAKNFFFWTYLSTWKRPLCSPYSTNVHKPSPVNQYRASWKNDGKPR